jgi:type IV secretory pathway protease TraF
MGETTPAYIWNASRSVPIGLYQLQPAGRLTVTELVAVRPAEPLATFLDLNGYLPIGVPMLKRVLALPGQTVCRKGLTISVDAIEPLFVEQLESTPVNGRSAPALHFKFPSDVSSTARRPVLAPRADGLFVRGLNEMQRR